MSKGQVGKDRRMRAINAALASSGQHSDSEEVYAREFNKQLLALGYMVIKYQYKKVKI